MRYKFPEEALDKFTEVAKLNKSEEDHGHIETLGYFLGYEDETNGTVVATELVFPNQIGTSVLVSDEGKLTLKPSDLENPSKRRKIVRLKPLKICRIPDLSLLK